MERIYLDGYSPVSGCGASRIVPLSGNMPTALVTTRISAPRADDQIRFSRGKIGLFVAQGLPYFLQEEFRRHRRNWRAGPKRECLPQRVGRNHEGRANAAGRRGRGVQTGRGDLREISDRTGLSQRRDRNQNAPATGIGGASKEEAVDDGLGASRAVAAARRSGRCGFSLCWYRSDHVGFWVTLSVETADNAAD